MILVIGATGTNGREVVARLAAAGEKVRALVRDPGRAGDLRRENVEVAAGDLDDPASLDAALAGIDRAFFVAAVAPRFVGWFLNFLDAALRSGRPRVVKFSGMGAGVDSPAEIMRQHGETDEALAASGLPFTILRPNSFHQNLLWSAATIKGQGAFYLPMGDVRQSLVDVRDIADVAVRALTGAGHEGRTYDLTGPEALSYGDVAEILSRVLGRPIRFVDVPPGAALNAMVAGGMPEWNARAVTELYGAFAAETYARTTDAIEQITGARPTSFEQFARDHVAAFS
jgi:uncharacterized protein YbjT (DUF2867 family)